MNQCTEKTIGDFQVNERVNGKFLVQNIKKGETVQSKPYLDIELGDKTGAIIGKLWDVTFEAEQLKVGDIANAIGTVTEWQGVKQYKLEYIEKDRSENAVMDYVKSAPYTAARMDAVVEDFISKMTDPEIQSITGYIYNEHRESFLIAPAARSMHHALYGGLAYHTITMLRTAEKLLDVYPFLNSDLLYAGIILHDIAKTEEMVSELGVATDYTIGGNLLGHIVQGTMLIENAAVTLNISKRVKEVLQHLVVSHHEKGEWGSPQPPRTPEAIMLHFIDNIDAKMFMVKELIDGKTDEDYTEYHKGLRQKLFIY